MSKVSHDKAIGSLHVLENVVHFGDSHSNKYEALVNIKNYIIQQQELQEQLDKKLTETMIIANSRLERLNGLELEFDKQTKLLELYKEYYKADNLSVLESDYTSILIKKHELQEKIKGLENE